MNTQTIPTEIEIFTIEARLSGLKSRIQLQKDFIKRCQDKQRAGLGLVYISMYDPLNKNPKTMHRKKKRRKKTDPVRNYFTWDWDAISPHQVIKEAESKIEVLEVKLLELKEIDNE